MKNNVRVLGVCQSRFILPKSVIPANAGIHRDDTMNKVLASVDPRFRGVTLPAKSNVIGIYQLYLWRL